MLYILHVSCIVINQVKQNVLLTVCVCVGWVDGQPERLIYPTDSRGRLCGVHDAVRYTYTHKTISILETTTCIHTCYIPHSYQRSYCTHFSESVCICVSSLYLCVSVCQVYIYACVCQVKSIFLVGVLICICVSSKYLCVCVSSQYF